MSTSLSESVAPPPPARRAPERPRSGWFRAFWRWHFYASFLVIPVLLVFSVTGLIYLFIAASLTAFAVSQAERWIDGLFVAGGLGIAIAILVGIAKLLIFLVRKLLPQGWNFVLRQGVANLYRPNNRTLLLILSLGLGTFLLLTIYLTRDVLLTQLRSLDANNQPNIFLFDIQPDQKKAVADLVRSVREADKA